MRDKTRAVRVTEEEDCQLRLAAARAGVTVAAFLRDAALLLAHEVTADQLPIILSPGQNAVISVDQHASCTEILPYNWRIERIIHDDDIPSLILKPADGREYEVRVGFEVEREG